MFQSKSNRSAIGFGPAMAIASSSGQAAAARSSESPHSSARRPRRRVFVIVAVVALLLVGIPANASAYSVFGSAGQAATELTCHSGSRTIVATVTMYGTVYPQSMGRHLNIWVPPTAAAPNSYGWLNLSWNAGTPEGSVIAFEKRITVSGPVRRHYFLSEYYWFWGGTWRSGSPASEQTSIVC